MFRIYFNALIDNLLCRLWCICYHCSADSRFAPSQWETALLCNGVSHWLGASLHSSPKVMAVFLFLIFENFLIGGMFSILETIKTDRSTLILQNKNWCQMINPMCTTFQMWHNSILQNQVCFERLISLGKTPYIFVKISKPRNWEPYSISAMSHGNRTSSYETVAHKLRPSVAFDWQYTPRQKLWPFPQT